MQKIISILILLSAFVVGCKKADPPAVDPDALTNDEIRLTVIITAPGVQPTDTFTVYGNFYHPNYFNSTGTMRLKKKRDNIYSIDLILFEVLDNRSEIHFTIFRNGIMEELDENCNRIQERVIFVEANRGNEVKITVPAFQGTGNCSP